MSAKTLRTDAVAARVRFPWRRRRISGQAYSFSLRQLKVSYPIGAAMLIRQPFRSSRLQTDGLGNFYAQGMDDGDEEQQDLDQHGGQAER